MNTELTAEQAAAENADVIITAIGAKPIVPPIPGIDNEKVVGLEVLHQKAPALGHKVVILGGGLVGCESAIYLDSLGKDVTIVEMKNDWAADSYFMHKNAMVRAMRGSNIKINVNTKAKAVTAEGLVCETTDGEVTFEADSILLTAGMKADRAVAESFYNAAPRVFETGDCIKPGRVVEAVTNGYYRALDI
ncbi:FAD-dependent oxidoreductase [Clostridium ljungdahlii]|uniref:FAD-dependent oxidoreductase n=1 Tax=Clostridium ljungdahlii TaxID=1538 RepID=UPI00386C0692